MNQPQQQSFDPRVLRDALGEYATGVTVITARGPDGVPFGITINSFTSVSLDPPLVLWNLGLRSPSLALFEACTHYAVNILAADQADISQRFAQTQLDRCAGIEWLNGADGTPLLPGCCAWFECRNEMRYPGGDHLIFVGHVENFQRQEKPPLIFHRGAYRSLA